MRFIYKCYVDNVIKKIKQVYECVYLVQGVVLLRCLCMLKNTNDLFNITNLAGWNRSGWYEKTDLHNDIISHLQLIIFLLIVQVHQRTSILSFCSICSEWILQLLSAATSCRNTLEPINNMYFITVQLITGPNKPSLCSNTNLTAWEQKGLKTQEINKTAW